MNRRTFLCGLTLGTLAAPLAAEAQQAGKIPRVLMYVSDGMFRDRLVDGLRDLGWIEGRDIIVEWRRAEPPEDPGLTAELGRVHADIAVLGGPLRIHGAMKVTRSIPLVGIDLESDPVASGFVKSLAHPGLNVSGIWMDLPELAGKQLQFLREVVPKFRRLGVIRDDRVGAPQFTETESAARAINVKVVSVSLRRAADAHQVMTRLIAERPDAVLILTSPVTFFALPRIGEVARNNRLPSITPFSTYPASGGLMAYGPSFPAIWKQAATYVHRVLKGSKIGDLPVERPARFELLINLKIAKAIGLTIPQTLLPRADHVIE